MSTDGFTLKDATGRVFRFEPAPFDIEVVDVWPPGTLTDAAKDAYDAPAAAGRIIPRGLVARDAAGRVIVRYMADIPEQWIRQELRVAKLAGRQMRMERGERNGQGEDYRRAETPFAFRQNVRRTSRN